MRVPVYIQDRIYIQRSPAFNEVFSELREEFTYPNPEYIKRKRLNKWTGGMEREMYIWDHVNHPQWGECLSIPRGGISKLRKVFDQYDLIVYPIDRRLSLEPVTHLYNDVTLRPDQQKLADAMLKVQNCLIRSPTGSGKTEVALKVTESILKDAGPVLVIVWETELMDQWIERACKRFGLRESDIGILGGGKKKRIKPITIGMQQTLRNKITQYAPCFGGIIADEVQRFAAGTYQHVIDLFPAKYRIGISANETRHDKLEYLIYDMFGDVADEIEKATLIDQGAIHDVTIRMVPTDFEYELIIGKTPYQWHQLDSSDKNFNNLLASMTSDKERNDLIWSFLEPNLQSGNHHLIITHRVEHAKYWDQRIRAAGYSCGLMLGGKKNAAEFKATQQGLIQGTIRAGIGTVQKIGQALDIPRWNRGHILTPMGGNEQLFEQIIGRLRRTHEEKSEAVCYYYWDNKIYPHHKKKLIKNYPHVQMWVNGEFLTAS